MDGLPYVLTEAYLSGNPAEDKALLKLSPGKQGSNAAHNYVEQLEARQRGQPLDARAAGRIMLTRRRSRTRCRPGRGR